MPKNTILFIEDAKDTIQAQMKVAQKYFEHVRQESQLHEVKRCLENTDSYCIKAIVLDIMLQGVQNLTDLDSSLKVDTNNGYEAGWRILEYYLRSSHSPFKHIPVLVHSVRDSTKESQQLLARLQQQPDVAPIEWISKGINVQQFETFLKTIKGNNK